MITRLLVAVLSFAFLGFSSGKPTRDPVPFTSAYKDGFVLVLWSSYGDEDLARVIERVHESGAEHLTIPYYGCQSTIRSSDVGACQMGDEEQAVRAAKIALSQGFDVTLLPVIVTPHWDWRGDFDPDDVDDWFKSYKAWLRGLVQIANELHLQDFVVATEFSKLYRYEDRWSQLLSEFHSLFAGPLIVTTNWDELDHGFWADADAIGVSSYHPLSDAQSPSDDALLSGMQGIKAQLIALAEKWNRPIVLTETGFPSTHAAARTPWLANEGDGLDPALQASCYTAFSKVWANEKALVRTVFWATSDPDSPTAAYDFEVLGKPAEPVVGDFFAARKRLRLPI